MKKKNWLEEGLEEIRTGKRKPIKTIEEIPKEKFIELKKYSGEELDEKIGDMVSTYTKPFIKLKAHFEKYYQKSDGKKVKGKTDEKIFQNDNQGIFNNSDISKGIETIVGIEDNVKRLIAIKELTKASGFTPAEIKTLVKEKEKNIKENKQKFKLQKEEEKILKYNEKIINKKLKIAKDYFSRPDLLINIHNEISKDHKTDNSEKLLCFLVLLTSYLLNHKDHKSNAVKGDSSVGKNNMINSVIKHFPSKDKIILTSSTSSSIEDSIDKYKIIYLSEINLKNDKGENAHLVEKIKQLTEGGTSVLKKISVGKKWKAVKIEQEQKTVIYSTTESSTDEELDTRFIVSTVKKDVEKNRIVNKNTEQEVAGIINPSLDNISWIYVGIQKLLKYNDVIFPIAVNLPIGFVDCNDSRSMRDYKRFWCIAKAVAYLYQNQREINKDKKIIGTVFDLNIALIISSKFFNYTYSGLGDQRLQEFMDMVDKYLKENEEYEEKIFPRHKIQQMMGVSKNTIKDLSKGCQEVSNIEFYDKQGNIILYKRCQKGIKKVLLGVNWYKVLQHFQGVKGVKIFHIDIYYLFLLDFLCNFKDYKVKFIKNNEKKNFLYLWDFF